MASNSWLAAFAGELGAFARADDAKGDLLVLRLAPRAIAPTSAEASSDDATSDVPEEDMGFSSFVDVDVVDEQGVAQPGVGLRLLWFGGCMNCGWSGIAETLSNAKGRARLTWEESFEPLGGWWGKGSLAVAPAFASSGAASVSVDVSAPRDAPVRLVVPRRVPALLLVTAPAEFGPLPPFVVWLRDGTNFFEDDVAVCDISFRQLSVKPGVALPLAVQVGVPFAAYFHCTDNPWLDGECSFTATDDPSSWRIELPIRAEKCRRVVLTVNDANGMPIVHRELAWDLVGTTEPYQPFAPDGDPWVGIVARARTSASGNLELLLPADLDESLCDLVRLYDVSNARDSRDNARGRFSFAPSH